MDDPTSVSRMQSALSLMHHVNLGPLLAALVRRGVPDHLNDGPLAASDLAQLAQFDELSLTRALRALSAFGAFQEVSPGTFTNNALSEFFRNRPGGLRNSAMFYGSEHYLRSAAALGHSVETGQSATTHVFGESVWEHFRKHPEEGETFNLALAELRGDEHQQIANAYDWTSVKTLVDVGGGIGSLLAAVLEKQQAASGVLIEQPALLADADRVLSKRGMRDRCELVAGSFFDPMSAVGDVWSMCQVLHDWPDAECCAILKRCRDAMRTSDRLLVMEMLTVPCRPSIPVAMIDVTMLMYFGEARQRTVDEYKKLFESTGFTLGRVLPTGGAFSIVEAQPA